MTTIALLNSPAEITRAFLLGKTVPNLIMPIVGSNTAWQIYVPKMPDGQGTNIPDSCLCVNDTTGTESWRSLATGKTVYRFGVQIRLRSGNDQTNQFETGQTLMNAIRDLLDPSGPGKVNIAGNIYPIDGFVLTSPVIHTGQDIHRREQWSINAFVFLGAFT